MSAPSEMFEVRYHGDEVLLRVSPPQNTIRANLIEIQKELDGRDIDYDPDKMLAIYRRANNEFEFLTRRTVAEFEVILDISPDLTEARMTVTPPTDRTAKLDPGRIKEVLAKANLKKGIQYDAIRAILAKGGTQGPVVVAKGKEPVHGEDGSIRSNFQNSGNKSLELDPDDPTAGLNSADYKELDLFQMVEPDELIAQVVPPRHGEDGFDIRGRTIRARVGKSVILKPGKNVKMDDYEENFFTKKQGFAVITGNTISVEEVLFVENVDSSTGNVRFNGVVHVKGHVEDAFLVEAEKGLQVDGMVGKATLKCKGDIQIKGGVMGARLEASNNIFAKFLSDTSVRAGQNVTVEDYVLHSQVDAGGHVHVTKSPKGFIVGGLTRARTEISTPVIGSSVSEEITRIQVGLGMDVRARYDSLLPAIGVRFESFEKTSKSLNFLRKQRAEGEEFDEMRRETYKKMLDAASRVRDELMKNAKALHRLREQMGQVSKGGLVMVSNIVNAGAQIQIQREQRKISSPLEATAFTLSDKKLEIMPFSKALRLRKSLRGS